MEESPGNGKKRRLYSAYFLTLAPSAVFAVYTAEEHERGPKTHHEWPHRKECIFSSLAPGHTTDGLQ